MRSNPEHGTCSFYGGFPVLRITNLDIGSSIIGRGRKGEQPLTTIASSSLGACGGTAGIAGFFEDVAYICTFTRSATLSSRCGVRSEEKDFRYSSADRGGTAITETPPVSDLHRAQESRSMALPISSDPLVSFDLHLCMSQQANEPAHMYLPACVWTLQ